MLLREVNIMALQKLDGLTLGKYQLREQLGHGGMASVYRAYHPQLDRFVAVKVLRGELVEDADFLARFQREAKIVAALRHANIVQVFDADSQDSIYYMVMELLEGDTLKARLNAYRARGVTMPLGEVVRIMLDVLDGLAYAHSEGMIHRDIKPANIMLTKRGQAVITDFGIAQIIGSTRHTMSGALMGTLNYISPEQGMQNQSDARSDLYSLGIALYEMLTDHTPFDADTPLAILMKHVNEPLPLPSTIGITIPAPFERVLLKVLSKDPNDRYQTATDMAQAVRSAAEEAQVQLPDRISLPLSFQTGSAEPVAVISGTAREKLTNIDFAKDNTDENLGEKLKAEQKAAEPVVKIDWGRLIRKYGKITLGFLGIIIGVNLIFVGAAGLAGRLDIFIIGWPLQVFVVGLAFAYVLTATRWFWVSIIAGTLLTAGGLLTYYWFNGNWTYWSPWMLLVPVTGGLILAAIWLHTLQRQSVQKIAYYTGLTLMALSAVIIVAGMILVTTNPDGLLLSPFARNLNELVHQAITQGMRRGFQSIPDLPQFGLLRELLIATPVP
jgi:serine/threonine protein kinase